ncbi:MAG TPA: primosomal protein N', partial [Pseudobdellovibrionaceae bacterium]|nr:primosomal protein N' [Pseudobdellovibrionaceae bacterium]
GGFELKFIECVDAEYAPLPEHFVRWVEWLSRYYLYPPGPTALSALPPLSRQVKERKSKKAPVVPDMAPSKPPVLTEEQSRCIEDIRTHEGFHTHLVFGVTGSGKTEIYLQLLEKVLAEGKAGLVLVPEISLTPQLVQRFAARFGDSIAALHSQLTDRERTNQWWDMVEGRKKILIGARSALFCPIENLGLIVVDEEHEPSFKQDEKLKYHGRDAAVMLGHLKNCPVILGSATPSLETWNNALEGKYRLHTMKNRVAGRELPSMKIVDLREKPEPSKNYPINLPYWMSPDLYLAMNETLSRGEQVALFLNRRGMANLVVCPSCGHTRECPNCDINLTLHAGNHLVCHYCDYHENFKQKCTDCREGQMETIGLGTELIEKDLAPFFPGKRISRADRDEIQNRIDLEEMVRQMEEGETDILVGTQMIAKGLDFPKLKLVGLVLADVGFNLPDFRATERSFQLITQMAGRSGRHVQPGESPGSVIIQTFNTEHDSLQFALHHDFEGFAAHEIGFRKALNYPPSGRLISFRIQAGDLGKAKQTSRLLASRARAVQERHEPYKSLEILGPAEAPLARIRNQYRFQILMKGPKPDLLNSFARQILGDEKWIPAGARIL